MSDRPAPAFTEDQLKPRPFRITAGGNDSERIAYALTQIAEALCRIDQRLSLLTKTVPVP